VRLFVAVDLDDAARRGVSDAAADLRQACERRDRTLATGLAWVKPSNLHLTLHFLGEVDERQASAIRDTVSAPVPLAPFEIGLASWGLFPSSGAPRVLWVGVASGADAVRSAHRVIGDRLNSVGAALEARPLSAHLTVARVKDGAGRGLRELVAGTPAPPTVAWTVPHATLYRSHLGPDGPRYEVLARIPFEP
jgi:RNA 2',3'-cyclic 3'-phosphodiesterase